MKRTRTVQISLGLGVVLTLVVVAMILAALPAAARPAGPESEQSTSQEQAAPAATLANIAAGDAGDFLLSQVDSDQDDPAIAYNTDDDQFLLVWSEAGDIYGQVFSDKGVPQGTSFPISTNAGIQMNPTAAYNSSALDFLVVWTDLRNGLGDIYGQVINADGSLPTGQDPTTNYPISTATGYQQYPTLAYNQTRDEYMVVWNDTRAAIENLDIYGQLVDADGTLLGNTDPAVNLAISTAPNHQSNPVIAYNPLPADNYLIVWDDNRNSNLEDIYGQLVNADGALQGANFAISTANNTQDEPAIAYNSLADEYLVVWDDQRDQPSPDIYGQRVGAAGTLRGDNFAISDASRSQSYPTVTYNANHDQYLVVWKDDRAYSDDIYGRRVGSDGTLAPQGDFAISTAIEDQQDPALAYSTGSDQFMVVWEDHRTGEYAGHVHGQRVWWPGLLVGHEFSVSSQGNRQNPAVAYDTREHLFLAVWSDDIDGDYDIYGQLYHHDHYPVSPVFAITDLDGNQINPAVAYNQHDRNYLVVFEGPSGIGAQLLTTQGTPDHEPFFIWSEGAAHWPAVAYTTNGPADSRAFLVTFTAEEYWLLYPTLATVAITGHGLTLGATPVEFVIVGSIGRSDLVYNPTNNEFFVIWSSSVSGNSDLYGRRLSYDGLLLDFRSTIANAALGQRRPAASYNPDNEEYLVVWEDYRNVINNADIYAQRIDAADGSVLGGNIPVATSSLLSNQRRPDVIYAETMGRYRVIYQDDRDTGTLGWDLRGQWLNADGTNAGTFDAPLLRYLGDQEEPAIAYSQESLYNQALTIWEDNRVGSDIYGSFAALDDDPPIARFNRFRRIGRAGQTFIFNAWPSRDDNTPRGDLQVRWDLDNDGAWEPSITDKFITYTLSSAGVHTVTLGVWDGALLSDTISHRIVVLPATRAPLAAPTATLTVSPTWAAAGTTFELDGSGSNGDGTLNASWDWDDDGIYDTAWSPDLQVTHTYTVAGDYTIRLMIKDDSGTTDAALQNITVVPAAPTQLELTPQMVTMTPGEALRFRTTGQDQYGNQNYYPEVTWSVTNEMAGTISTGGVFTATTNTAVYTDVIQLQSNSVTQFASVTIRWPYQIYLPLTLRSP